MYRLNIAYVAVDAALPEIVSCRLLAVGLRSTLLHLGSGATLKGSP